MGCWKWGRVGTCFSCSTDKEPWFSVSFAVGMSWRGRFPSLFPLVLLGQAWENGASVRVGVRSGSWFSGLPEEPGELLQGRGGLA